MNRHKIFLHRCLRRVLIFVISFSLIVSPQMIRPDRAESSDDAASKIAAKISCDKLKELALKAPLELFKEWATTIDYDGAGVASQIIRDGNVQGLLENLGDVLTAIQVLEEAVNGTPEEVAKIVAGEMFKKALEKLGTAAGTGVPGAIWTTMTILNEFAKYLDEEILGLNIKTLSIWVENNEKNLQDSGAVEYLLRNYFDADFTRGNEAERVKRRAFLITYAGSLGIKNFPRAMDWQKDGNWNQVRSVARSLLTEAEKIADNRRKVKQLQGQLKGQLDQLKREAQIIGAFQAFRDQVNAMVCDETPKDCIAAYNATLGTLEKLIADAGDIKTISPASLAAADQSAQSLDSLLTKLQSDVTSAKTQIDRFCAADQGANSALQSSLEAAQRADTGVAALAVRANGYRLRACSTASLNEARTATLGAQNAVDEATQIADSMPSTETSTDTGPPQAVDFSGAESLSASLTQSLESLEATLRDNLDKRQSFYSAVTAANQQAMSLETICPSDFDLSLVTRSMGRIERTSGAIPDLSADLDLLRASQSRASTLEQRLDTLKTLQNTNRQCLAGKPDPEEINRQLRSLAASVQTNLSRAIEAAEAAAECYDKLNVECKTNEVRNAEGVCVCGSGYERDANDNCVPVCGANERRNADGQCVPICAEGERLVDGVCVPVCGPNETLTDGVCECRSGYERDAAGNCIAVPEDDKCSSNADCPVDYVCNPQSGACVFRGTPACQSNSDCSTGYECNKATGDCDYVGLPDCTQTGCPKDYECNRTTGECEFIRTPACRGDNDCPRGYECKGGECVFIREPQCRRDIDCPRGYECKGGECVFIRSDSGCRSNSDCSIGFVCRNGACVSPFDQNYEQFGSNMSQRDQQRDQQNIDRSSTDQSIGRGGRGSSGYGADDLEQTLDQTMEDVSRVPERPPRDERPTPPAPPSDEPTVTTTDPEPPAEEPPGDVPPPASSTGIGIEEVGSAPEGQTLIVEGQLVPVENWPVKIAGMTLNLTGPVNRSTTSSGSGSFSFSLIPSGEYVISVAEWNWGMTRQSFTAPSGKSIRIVLQGSCPYLFVWDGEDYRQENDIYSVARVFPHELLPAEGIHYASMEGIYLQPVDVTNLSPELQRSRSYRDFYQLTHRPRVDEDGNYRLMVREQDLEFSFSDLLELWAVDHQPDSQVAVTRSGQLLSYSELFDLPVTPQQMYNDDILDIALPASAFNSGLLAIDWQGYQDGNGLDRTSAAGRPQLILQRLDPDGLWQTIDWSYPRDESQISYFVLEGLGEGWDGTGMVRLLARSCHKEKYHRVDAVSWGHYLPETPVSAKLELSSAIKTGGADVRQLALYADGEAILLAPEEEIHLKYRAVPEIDGLVRSYVFASEGVYIPMPKVKLLALDK